MYSVLPPVLFLFTIPLVNWVWTFPGKETDQLYFWGFFLGNLVGVPFTYWIADLFMRVVDENSVKFSKWWYGVALKAKL